MSPMSKFPEISVASGIQKQISRLKNAKTALKTAIEGKGVTVPADVKMDAMADLVDAIEPSLQSKTISPSRSQTIVEPDDGYDGLSTVTVDAVPQPSWTQNDSTALDYIKNRPGGYTQTHAAETITWDGTTSGHSTVTIGSLVMTKVSDSVFVKEQLIGGTFTYLMGSTSTTITLAANNISKSDDLLTFGAGGGLCYVIPTDNYTLGSATIPTKGTWAMSDFRGLTSIEATVDHKIAAKYLDVVENFTVTATASSLAATTATLDKTLAQIEAAYQAGNTLVCKLVVSGSTGAVVNLTTAQRNTATGNFIFSGVGVVISDSGTASCYAGYVYISSGGATVSMNLIPADGNGVSY